MMSIKNNIYLVLLMKSSILSVFEIGNDQGIKLVPFDSFVLSDMCP